MVMVCPARWNCADTTHSFDVLRTVCTVRAQPLMWELSLSRKPTYCFYLVCVRGQSLSHVWLFTTPWTGALEAPLSMEFSRQECWSGLPFPTPGDLPDPGVKSASPALVGGFFTTVPPGKLYFYLLIFGCTGSLLLHAGLL